MLPQEEFFYELLKDTELAFNQSCIQKLQLQKNQRWNYSVCATPIQVGKGIILGINWGADKNGHEPQFCIPNAADILSDNFIKRSKPYLEEEFNIDFNNIDFNYTNLCFFRTPSIKELSSNDYSLSLPLFKKYVMYIKPKWLLSLGYKNYDQLLKNNEISEVKQYPEGEAKFHLYKAKLWGFDIYFVPHPNARVKSEWRAELWRYINLNEGNL